jgi:hypothetical protein
MKLSFILPVATLLSCLAGSVVAGVPHPAIHRRDGESSSVTSSSHAPSTTKDGSDSPQSNSHRSNDHSTHDPTAASTTSLAPSATASGSLIWNITHGHHHQPDGELPLQPIITPAMGVAGAFLLVTGIGYTLIGIKNAW